MLKNIYLRHAITVSLLVACCSACSIARENVLECGLSDGSKFVLRSKYQWSAIPLPLGHNSRAQMHQPWRIEYRDTSGRSSEPPTDVNYNNVNLDELVRVCAHLGMRSGAPLANFTYLQSNGKWLQNERDRWAKLHVDADKYANAPDGLSPKLRLEMEKAGINGSTYDFAYMLKKGDRVVYEQPLHREIGGYLYNRTFDAVYQSYSLDDGKTWATPVITTDAEIFEMGKSWIEQSFRARPIKINGKPIKTEFPPSGGPKK